MQLSKCQRGFCHHALLFDRPLSHEVGQALHRACLAGAENNTPLTDAIGLFCGLCLEFGDEMQLHFRGDLDALVRHIFPKHRLGDEGLVPGRMIESAASDEDDGGMGFPISLTDGAIQLLWTATRLANSVGKKTSLNDCIAAIAVDAETLLELSRHNIHPRHRLADVQDILRIVFFAPFHAGWPKIKEFEVDHPQDAYYAVRVKTPSGGFAPMRGATVA